MRHPGLPLASFLVTAAIASTALCQTPAPATHDDAATKEARALYANGVKLLNDFQFGEALTSFEKSMKLRPHPVTRYSIAECQRDLGQYTRARLTYVAALAESTSGELPASLADVARSRVEEIGRLLAKANVTIDPPDAGMAVDGRPLTEGPDGNQLAGVAAAGPGAAVSRARFTMTLDPGAHLITLSRKGFSDVVLNRTFAPGSTIELPLELARLPATLHVKSNEPRSIVTVDSADVGAAPVDVTRPAGTYRVVVKKEGFELYEARVAVNAGEEANLQATMIEKHTPITKTWWFWTSAAAVVAGGITLTYFLTRSPPQSPPYDGGSTGWVVSSPSH